MGVIHRMPTPKQAENHGKYVIPAQVLYDASYCLTMPADA
jgi:hypothetical protein